MPPREPKARLLTREYVADRDFMVTLSAVEREWYLLTALYADDAGFLEWSLEENAANIYRYDSPGVRERRVERIIARLGDRFSILECGRHAEMPRVAKRPRSGGREYAVRDAHESEEVHRKPKRRRSKSTTSPPGVDSGVDHESTPVLSSPVPSTPVPSRPARAKERDDDRSGRPSSFRELVEAAMSKGSTGSG